MPMKTTRSVAMSTRGSDQEASGDVPNSSDFGFSDDEDDYYDADVDNYSEFSGSGDGGWSQQKLNQDWIRCLLGHFYVTTFLDVSAAPTASPAAESRPSGKVSPVQRCSSFQLVFVDE